MSVFLHRLRELKKQNWICFTKKNRCLVFCESTLYSTIYIHNCSFCLCTFIIYFIFFIKPFTIEEEKFNSFTQFIFQKLKIDCLLYVFNFRKCVVRWFSSVFFIKRKSQNFNFSVFRVPCSLDTVYIVCNSVNWNSANYWEKKNEQTTA